MTLLTCACTFVIVVMTKSVVYGDNFEKGHLFLALSTLVLTSMTLGILIATDAGG
jgi:hypothetical protein